MSDRSHTFPFNRGQVFLFHTGRWWRRGDTYPKLSFWCGLFLHLEYTIVRTLLQRNAFMEKYAYAAGLIDGEGSVMFISAHKGKLKAPTVSMSSTTYALVLFMKTEFGGSIRKQKVYKVHHKQAWVWSIKYNRALACLTAILPFLQVPEKRHRALLLVNEYKTVVHRTGKYTPELLAKRAEFESRFFHPSDPSALPVKEPISL